MSVISCLICGMGENACKGHPALSGQFAPVDIPQVAANKAMFQVSERLYLDDAGNAVKANNPRKQSLLVAAGGLIPLDDARRYGLLAAEQPAKSVEDSQAVEPEKPKKNGVNRRTKGRGTRRA